MKNEHRHPWAIMARARRDERRWLEARRQLEPYLPLLRFVGLVMKDLEAYLEDKRRAREGTSILEAAFPGHDSKAKSYEDD